jgi:uncharacterized protein
MEQRVSLITLGVTDLARSRQFYIDMGWEPSPSSDDEIVFFQSGGMVIGLWGRESLAEDSGVTDTGGWGGVTLAHNVGSPAEVHTITEEARSAGGIVVREPAETFWGGYSSVFLDPDGHPWEIAHNPYWTLASDGSLVLGD